MITIDQLKTGAFTLYWRIYVDGTGEPAMRDKQPAIGPRAPKEYRSERAARKAAGPDQRAKGLPAGICRPIIEHVL